MTLPNDELLPIKGTYVFTAPNLHDDAGVALPIGSTITWALRSQADPTVLASGNMVNVNAEAGHFRGEINSSITSTLTEGAFYYLEININAGAGFRRLTLKAGYQGWI